jgi:ubiquitin-like protein ATG12
MSFNPLVSEGESSDEDAAALVSPVVSTRPISPRNPANLPQQEEDGINDADNGNQSEEQIQNDLIKSKIPMSASIILTKLPEATNKVISKLENLTEENEQIVKITVRCNPIGSTPPLKPNVFKISQHQQFSTLIKFIGKKLKRKEGVFVYLNNSFAPGPDEIIGNLYKVS